MGFDTLDFCLQGPWAINYVVCMELFRMFRALVGIRQGIGAMFCFMYYGIGQRTSWPYLDLEDKLGQYNRVLNTKYVRIQS